MNYVETIKKKKKKATFLLLQAFVSRVLAFELWAAKPGFGNTWGYYHVNLNVWRFLLLPSFLCYLLFILHLPRSPILIRILHQLHFLLRTISQILPRLLCSLCQSSCLFWKILILLAVLLDTAACFLFLNATLIISFSNLESSPALYIPACYSTFKRLSHLGDW